MQRSNDWETYKGSIPAAIDLGTVAGRESFITFHALLRQSLVKCLQTKADGPMLLEQFDGLLHKLEGATGNKYPPMLKGSKWATATVACEILKAHPNERINFFEGVSIKSATGKRDETVLQLMYTYLDGGSRLSTFPLESVSEMLTAEVVNCVVMARKHCSVFGPLQRDSQDYSSMLSAAFLQLGKTYKQLLQDCCPLLTEQNFEAVRCRFQKLSTNEETKQDTDAAVLQEIVQ